MKPVARSLLAAWIALAALLPAQWSHAEVTGTVHELVNPEAAREAWRRQPLANAYVVITWTITIPTPAHATTSCRYSEIARTDGSGRYAMEGPNFVTAGLANTHVLVYAPGRDSIPFPYPGSPMKGQDVTMTKSARSPEERIGFLSDNARPGCFEQKVHDPRGLMKPYLDSLLAEARTLNLDTQAAKSALASLEAAVKRGGSGVGPVVPADPVRVVPVPARGQLQRAHPAPAN